MASKTKTEIRQIIDAENFKGCSKNIDLSGYLFQREDSFISFKFVKLQIDGSIEKVAKISYIHYESRRDFITLMAYFCNFCLGNNVKFVHMYEIDRENAARDFMAMIGFYNRERENNNIRYIGKRLFEIFG